MVSFNKTTATGFILKFPLLPNALKLDDSEELELHLINTVLPSFSSNPVEIPGQGHQMYMEGGGVEFSQGNATFHVDSKWFNGKTMFNGMSLINNNRDIHGMNKRNYVCSPVLHIMDNWETPVMEIVFTDAGPISLGDVNFSYTDGDSTLQCDVTFQYDNYYIDD